MGKKILYIALILMTCFSCEEIYQADLDDVENFIVIEALITNDQDVNFVKVFKTRDFYDDGMVSRVEGATVELIDDEGQSFWGAESGIGNFVLSHNAIPGKTYKLIVVAEGDTYESEIELMPPVPTYDSLYVIPETIVEYRYNYLGVPYEVEKTGLTAYIDLPIADSLSQYRFEMTKTVEWKIDPPIGSSIATFGWIKNNDTGVFNIKAPLRYSNEDLMKKHSLLFMSNRIELFLPTEILEAGAYMVGWVIDVDQYGMSENSYSFYESMNGQLEAEGKLFDPVYSQLESNFTCINNPDKEVIGFFELSSYRYFRFFAMSDFGSTRSEIHLTSNTAVIPATNSIESDTTPAFWEIR